MESVEKLSQKIVNMLMDVYKNKDDKSKINDLVNFMNTSSMKEVYKKYLELDASNEIKDISKSEIELLRIILETCNTIYNYTGESTGLSDSEYDILLEAYKDVSGSDHIITEPLISNKNVITHKYTSLRGTLDKIYKITEEDFIKNKSQKSLEDWVNSTQRRYENATGKPINLYEEEVYVMPKFDGVSCVFECDKDGTLLRALTRGDTTTNEAQDITHIFKNIFTGPLKNEKYPYGLKTEIMMNEEELDKYNKEYNKNYKNTRSIVSSIINSDEVDERVNLLEIIPLRYSTLIDGVESEQKLANGVYDYPFIKCKLKEVDKIRNFSFENKYVRQELRCDGSVIYLINPEVQKALGRENEKQKFEVAFKFTEETTYSEIKDIIFTTGLFGRLSPVAVFKPVKMKGNTISQASLGSFKRYTDLKLAKGDIVKIIYDIIPYADFDESDKDCKRSLNKEIPYPTYCPECGAETKLSENGNILYCVNPSCPCREKGKILNYIRKMKIGVISYETVDTLYSYGLLKSIEDLYKLHNKVKQMKEIPGFGNTKINAILYEIDSKRTVTHSIMLGSLGIEGLSVKKFYNILGHMDYNTLIKRALDGDPKGFDRIRGIYLKTTNKLIKGIKENEELIYFLENELNLIEDEYNKNVKFKVLFTKIRDAELEKFIKEHGGETVESLNKKVSFVIIPMEGTTSSKTEKAVRNKIPVIPIAKARDYILKNYK